MLRKKMFRDLKDNKGAYLACIVIMVLGILVFTSFSLTVDNLQLSQETFYNRENFADGFVKVRALPYDKLKNLEGIRGLAQIEGRIVQDVQVHAPEKSQNIYLRLVSRDPFIPNPINGVHLTQGIPLKPKTMDIWLDNNFLTANNLELNASIDIIVAGNIRTLNIVGTGMSPEFIYALRTSADIYPSPETFGIAFLPLDIMETISADKQMYNDLVFKLDPGVTYSDIEDELKDALKPYGLISMIPRADQTSHLLLTEELTSLEAMATSLPLIFLAIAAMILYITLKRMIEQQRGQIGILKAFGYSTQEILAHYLSYSLLIALVGSILGGSMGMAFSYPLTDFYQTFFTMPSLYGEFSFSYLLAGMFFSVLFSFFAGYQGCKKILTLEPAEAMRPPAPIIGKKIWLEKITPIWQMLTVQGVMAVRNLSRNKGRSIFIFLGILFCFAISGFTWSMNDMLQKMLFDQYEKVELYDMKIITTEPSNAQKVSRELLNFPGVSAVEPLAEIPISLEHSWLKKDLILIGLLQEGELYNILDKKYNKILPPDNGLLLSERLAEVLEAPVGTMLTLESLLPTIKEIKVPVEVVGVIPQYLGVNAYMEINAVQKILQEKNLATSYMLTLEKDSIPLLKETYRNSEIIAGINEKAQSLAELQEMMATVGSLIYVFAIIGVIIGFAIIYSSSIITLSERSRELASMLVLGMTPREVLAVITWEQWFVAVLAMLTGIPISQLLLMGMSQTLSNDIYTLPSTMTSASFIIAFLVTSLSIWIGQQVAAKKISTLSLVEVLKSRE